MSSLDLYAVRHLHGGTVYDGGRRWVGPGPGHSRRDASLSVRLEADGRALVHSFAGDPFRACAEHLGLELSHGQRADPAEAERLRRERDVRRREQRNSAWAFCDEVWSGTVGAEDTPAEAYLTRRGLPWPYPADLRFHPAAPLDYERRRHACALVALVRSADGVPKGLHVTALRHDGSGKARFHNPRRMFGACAGNAVHLAPARLGELAVAEGVETALSFARLRGVPTWAALSTAGVHAFHLPAGLSLLSVAADGDQAGRAAAEALAARASKRCDAQVIDPGDGLDFNDVLMGGAHE